MTRRASIAHRSTLRSRRRASLVHRSSSHPSARAPRCGMGASPGDWTRTSPRMPRERSTRSAANSTRKASPSSSGRSTTRAPRALHEVAEAQDAGLLAVGSTNRGAIGRVLPRSTAERLMHGAPCPIAIVPEEWEAGDGLNTIGVAYVDTDEGREALRGAHALAPCLASRCRAKREVPPANRCKSSRLGEMAAGSRPAGGPAVGPGGGLVASMSCWPWATRRLRCLRSSIGVRVFHARGGHRGGDASGATSNDSGIG